MTKAVNFSELTQDVIHGQAGPGANFDLWADYSYLLLGQEGYTCAESGNAAVDTMTLVSIGTSAARVYCNIGGVTHA